MKKTIAILFLLFIITTCAHGQGKRDVDFKTLIQGVNSVDELIRTTKLSSFTDTLDLHQTVKLIMQLPELFPVSMVSPNMFLYKDQKKVYSNDSEKVYLIAYKYLRREGGLIVWDSLILPDDAVVFIPKGVVVIGLR